MNTVTFFGLTFDLNPVAFTIPVGSGWDVYWYGICIAVGFLLAFLYGIKRAPLLNINTDRLLDGIIITVPLAIVFARAYYLLFYSPSTFFKDFLKIHEGGLAIYGGIIGAVIGIIISCKTRGLKFLDCLDLTAPCLLIGQAIGRWGNFFNQEAFGTNTTWFTGMYSTGTSGTYEHIAAMNNPALDPTKPVHPCFLYESVLCIIGFFILNHLVKRRKFRGEIALWYGVWYGAIRFFIEGIRTDSLMLGNVRVSQILSLLLVIACAAALFELTRRKKEKAESGNYENVFETDIGNDVSFTLADVEKLEKADESRSESAEENASENTDENTDKSSIEITDSSDENNTSDKA